MVVNKEVSKSFKFSSFFIDLEKMKFIAAKLG